MSESTIELSLAEAGEALEPYLHSNFAIMLRGRHGIGKSEFVYQLAQRDNLDLPVIERRASQMTDGDLLGLPDRTDLVDFVRNAVQALIEGDTAFFEQGRISEAGIKTILKRLEKAEGGILTKESVTRFCPPEWFMRACEEPVILFLDELDRASIDVRQGIFELSGSRKLFGRELHPETRVVAAINGGVHSAQYQVAELGPAELDRWVVFDVKPDAKVWLDWASESDRVCEEVWDFINNNRQHLFHDGMFEDGKVYPTPRSWTRLSQTIMGMEESLDLEKPEIDGDQIYKMSAATVGMEAASAFRRFWNDYEHEMSVEDFLANEWEFEDLEGWGIPDYSSMINKLDANGLFDELFTDEEAKPVQRFFSACPAEPQEVLSKHLSHAPDAPEDDSHKNLTKVYGGEDPIKGGTIADNFEEILKKGLEEEEGEEEEE